MGHHRQVLERPAICFGDPSDRDHRCTSEARVVMVQLRPDPLGRPVTFITAACMVHNRPVRTWLTESWPFDDVDSFGVDQADEHLAHLLDAMTEDGSHVLTSHGVA